VFLIPEKNQNQSRYLTYEQMNLINAFRGLNLDQAILSMLMVSAIIHNSQCANVIFARLLQVPYLAYNYFACYYGTEPAQQICNLMSQNIIMTKRLTEVLMAKDEQTGAAILQQWNNNIDSQSDLFASMNPYWAGGQWHDLLYRALQLNYQQIMALLANECEQSLNIFNRIKDLMILIGDYQARGIMKRLTEIPDILNKPESGYK